MHDCTCRYNSQLARQKTIEERMQQMEDENQRLRAELEELKDKHYPMASLIKKIQIAPPERFSTDSMSPRRAPKHRKQSCRHSINHN